MIHRHRVPPSAGRAARSGLVLFMAGLVLAACGSSTAAPAASTAAAAPLPAGTYTTKAFLPALTYTLPGGWENPADTAGYVQLRPVGSEVAGIHLFRDPKPASQDPSCPQAAATGVGDSSTDLLQWIRARPGLTVSDPKLVAIGGLKGVEIDLGIKDGWTTSCPFANGLPTVPLFVGANGDYRWVIAGSERLRLALLDAPGGTVVVDVDAFDGQVIDSLIVAADPIVRSFSFAKS